MSSGNNCECLSVIRLIYRFIFQMDKVLVYIIKKKEKKERHSLSIIEWHRSPAFGLRFITSSQPIYSWEIVFLFFLMVDQTDDIFHIEYPCSFKHNQIHIKIWRCCLPQIRLSEHTLQRTLILLCNLFFFVKIAFSQRAH
jgi:hypothetical protein